MLKSAIGEGAISPLEAATLEAVADAQARTGVSVITHTSGGGGLEQAKILTGAGADPKRVKIGHVDRSVRSVRPPAVHARHHPGRAHRRLSMDSICARIGEPSEFERDAPEPLVHLMTVFADLLDRYGVDRTTFEAILTANPARLFMSEGSVREG